MAKRGSRRRPSLAFSPFAAAEGAPAIDAGGRPGRDFAPERASPADVNLFDAVRERFAALSRRAGRQVAGRRAQRQGSRERLAHVL